MAAEPRIINGVYIQGAFLEPQYLRGTAFTEEDGAHIFRVTAQTAQGEPFALSGTVLAKVLRADNVTVDVDGSISDGAASVQLAADCYHAPGRFSITIFLSDGVNSVAIYQAIGKITRDTSGTELDSGVEVPSLMQYKGAYEAALEAAGEALAAADDAAAAADHAVRYDTVQVLTDEQKLQARTNIRAADITSLAPAFLPGSDYSQGDVVHRYGALYVFTADHPAGAWTGEDAQETTVDALLRKASASAAIAPAEAGSTAGAAHAEGSYFFLDGELCQATEDIAIGDAITPGTNCRTVPDGLSGDVAALNAAVYAERTEIYDWSKDYSSSFPYNWRTGYLDNGKGGAATSYNADYVRNYKAISFGNAKTITITPPSGLAVQAVYEYTSSTIGTANLVSGSPNNRYLAPTNTSTGIGESVTVYNVPGHYFAFSIGKYGWGESGTQYNKKAFADSIVASQYFLDSTIEAVDMKAPRVRVSKTDSSADFATIKDAVAYANQHPNTTIIVDSDTYDIIEELGGSDYTENLTSLSSYAGGLRLGNNTRIIGTGSGAKLTAIYTAATNQVMTDRFSIFNIVGSFRLENLDLEVQNVRYCVHEDMSALDAAVRPACYTAQYINCRMKHNGTVSQTFNPACCIGGGTMNKSLHIIDGCHLDSPAGKNPAGYHNNATSNNGVARVIVRDSYFVRGTMAFTIYNSNTQVIVAELIGNRFGRAIVDNSNGLFSVTEWENIYADQAGTVSPVAPVESGETASAAHAEGSYFIVDDTLYQATDDIAAGGTITPGTNCQELPGGLAGELLGTQGDVGNIESAIFEDVTGWREASLTFETGKFWTMTGTSSNYESAKRSVDLIPVTPGETIKVSTRISTNIAGVVFFSSATFSQSTFAGYDLYEIPSGQTMRTYEDAEVTVPAGAAYVVVQGRLVGYTGAVGLKLLRTVKISKVPALEDTVNEHINGSAFSPGADFEIANLHRRMANAEKANPFAWAAFDKAYFVFIHDDTNDWLETYAAVFHAKGEPMGAATIPSNITPTHLATLQQIVEDGGEILGHYNASPTEASSDLAWYTCTGAIKKSLEAQGFTVRGLIKANSTGSSTDKGQKYCQLYYDYADNHLGKTTQYNLPRTLMLNYADLAAFKARIDALENVNGIHAFGFHGGRQDEAWITAEAMADIIDYINGKSNCEITTYSHLFDTFGSTTLLERIKALEA